MKRHYLLFLILSLLALTCKKEAPPEPPPAVHVPTLGLTAEDASCTEAWLKLTTTQVPATVRLVRLTPTLQTLQTLQLTTPDTLVVDEGLLPRRTYTYKAYRLEVRGSVVDSSTQATVTTMDTTSHNFTWQIDTLGDGGGSVLYDVAIINDTLAYAVGEIYKRDSVGNWDPQAYNMVRWNGSTWQLMRIQFYTICGQSSRTPYPAKSIFAFSANDIWIAMDGDQVARWNGTTQTATMCLPVSFSIDKLWAENPNSVYAVGWGGNIMHYDGVRWRRIESGTGLDVYDVVGERNLRTGKLEVLAVAGKLFVNSDRKILRLSPTQAIAIPDSGIQVTLNGIWFKPDRHYYVVGGGMFDKLSSSSLKPWRALHPGITSVYTRGIAGAGLNDVVVCGSFGEVLHYNGYTWKSFRSHIGLTNADLRAVAVREHTVFIVGYLPPRAIVVRARRPS